MRGAQIHDDLATNPSICPFQAAACVSSFLQPRAIQLFFRSSETFLWVSGDCEDHLLISHPHTLDSVHQGQQRSVASNIVHNHAQHTVEGRQ